MLQIFIFSYNRGQHLLNLVSSIIAHIKVDYKTYIIDDLSDDPMVKKILKIVSFNDAIKVFQPETSKTGLLHRGLRNNMNYCVDNLMETDKISLFLQDDMQIIRDLLPKDISRLKEIYNKNSKNPFTAASFISINSKDYTTIPKNQSLFYYLNFDNNERLRGFGDVCCIYNNKLLESSFKFGYSEKQDEEIAYELFGPMPYSMAPFAAFCPQPKVYRSSDLRLNISQRYFNRVNGKHIFYKSLDREKVEKLFKSKKVPFGDEWLQIDGNKKIKKPYRYRASEPVGLFQFFIHFSYNFISRLFRLIKNPKKILVIIRRQKSI